MESTVMSSGDVAAIAGAPASGSADVRKRWLVLAVALVVGLGGAFALGSAVKKSSGSSTATQSGSLASPLSQSAQHASVAGLSGAGAIPAFKARPVKKKVVKPATSTSASASLAASTTPHSTVTPTTQQSVTPTPTHQVVTPTPTHQVVTPQPTVTQGGGG
jgi:hypothetical protein